MFGQVVNTLLRFLGGFFVGFPPRMRLGSARPADPIRLKIAFETMSALVNFESAWSEEETVRRFPLRMSAGAAATYERSKVDTRSYCRSFA